MMHCLRPRGPDGEGFWTSPQGELLLGHTRLAILDPLPRAAQPMVDPETGNALAFNGEIYNFRTLRQELAARGVHFRTESDTEVLLLLYRFLGLDLLERLRGMYAFLLWDAARRCLICAHDPFGIKPLYFALSREAFYAASQVRALVASGELDTSPEPAGHVGFFLWGAVPEPYTLYRSIRAVPPGGVVKVFPSGEVETSRFLELSSLWGPSRPVASRPGKRSQALAELREALRLAVSSHLVSDVPVGVFLSAGRDSVAVASLAQELSPQPLAALTLGIAEWRGLPQDEAPRAGEIAEHLKLKHLTRWSDRTEARRLISGFLEAMDQPTTDGLNTFLVSHAARQAGWKVALSGLGGDELFGGYPSFADVLRLVRFGKLLGRIEALQSLAEQLFARLPARRNPKFERLASWSGSLAAAYLFRRALFLPEWLGVAFERDFVEAGWTELAPLEALEALLRQASPQTQRDAISALETMLYLQHQLLRDTDWASLCHGVEVRVPYVDLELWHTVRTLEASGEVLTKEDLVRAASTVALPGQRFQRKAGFALPLERWFPEVWNDQTSRLPNPLRSGLRPWAIWIYEAYPGGADNAPWLGWSRNGASR